MRCHESRPDIDAHLTHFDALYAGNSDPWRVHESRDEAFKRRTIGYALGGSVLGRGLEIGCGNGISTRALARRFLRLAAIDGSPEAVALARQEAACYPRVSVQHCALPCNIPSNRFDAIIAAEVLYYLPARELDALLQVAYAAVRQGGYFVSTHHVRRFDDAECTHAALVERTRHVFGRARRQLSGSGWRCYLHVK